MKWQWKLARIAGIDIYMHTTFLLFIGWVAFSYWTEQGTIQAVLSGIFVHPAAVCLRRDARVRARSHRAQVRHQDA
jgi:hypothetical protein